MFLYRVVIFFLFLVLRFLWYKFRILVAISSSFLSSEKIDKTQPAQLQFIFRSKQRTCQLVLNSKSPRWAWCIYSQGWFDGYVIRRHVARLNKPADANWIAGCNPRKSAPTDEAEDGKEKREREREREKKEERSRSKTGRFLGISKRQTAVCWTRWRDFGTRGREGGRCKQPRKKVKEGTWQAAVRGFTDDWRLRLGAVDLASVKLEKKYKRSPHRQLKSYARKYSRASMKYDVCRARLPLASEQSLQRGPPKIRVSR